MALHLQLVFLALLVTTIVGLGFPYVLVCICTHFKVKGADTPCSVTKTALWNSCITFILGTF